MANREDMTGLEAGATLASLPLDSMIATLGIGIAKAQTALDENSLNTTIALATTTIDVPDPSDPENVLSRSLLSLGFVPTFYQFTEATLDLRIEMKMQMEENLGVNANADIKAQVGPVAIAASASVDYNRKYGAESSAMTEVHIAMKAVPPPETFLEWVRQLDQMPVAEFTDSSGDGVEQFSTVSV
jgi:hypothetical protein